MSTECSRWIQVMAMVNTEEGRFISGTGWPKSKYLRFRQHVKDIEGQLTKEMEILTISLLYYYIMY